MYSCSIYGPWNRALSRSFTGGVNGDTMDETFDTLISSLISKPDVVKTIVDKKETIIPMARRATERDLIKLEEYMKKLGISDTVLLMDIQEALLKAYQVQETPKGMLV